MKNRYHMQQIGRSAIALAVAMCFTGSAYAQNADGTIFGRAKAKEQIQIQNVENGSVRTIEASKDGEFTVPRLPSGQYKVTAGGVTKDVVVDRFWHRSSF